MTLPRPASASRIAIDAHWSLCRVAPGAIESAADLAGRQLDWMPATCPGTVAAALRAAGLEPDESSLRLDAYDWWYRGRFALAADDRARRWELRCEGLATLADVWLNGALLGHADNMFLDQRFFLNQSLAGDNEILIRFRSLNAFLGARRPRPQWRVPMLAHQQLRYARTTLLGRTPGWSPPYPAIGPWRPIWLEDTDAVRLRDVRVRAELAEGRGIVTFSATLTGTGRDAIAGGEFGIRGPGTEVAAPIGWTGNRLHAQVTMQRVAQWWPHTHGVPALYEPSLQLHSASLPRGATSLALRQIGFRKLTVDRAGDGFRLLVNDVPVFCRGACWTPLDAAALASSPDAYDAAVRQGVDAGMNMLRVGGTMVYEHDSFYAAASRHGMLVWQDFMFANMDYPAGDAAFVDSVRREAAALLARVGDEPCLAVLCGNSEVEQQAAMWGAPRERWSPALFHEILPALCAAACPGVPYWPSSAHGGAFPHQASAGTSSYYGVGAYLRPLDDARRAGLAFATESLGFANVPEPANLALLAGGAATRVHSPGWKARAPRDLGAGWDFDDVRDHYLGRVFGADATALRSVDHERYLALSRVVSGEVMAATFAEWRRTGSTCGGALVWFLRDLWPGAGWGLVAADGTPKAAWYILRRTLQPRAVFFTDEGVNGLDLHVVNDPSLALTGRLELRLYARGEAALRGADIPISLAAHAVQRIAVAAHLEDFMDVSYSYRFGAPPADVLVATLVDAGGAVISQAFHLPAGPLLEPRALGLAATGRDRGDGTLVVSVATQLFARSVRLEIEGAVASDNYFHLAPGARREIELRVDRPSQRLAGTVAALNGRQAARIAWASGRP